MLRTASLTPLLLAVACASTLLDPGDPTHLRRPFTADQIREAMPVGLVLKIRRQLAGEGESWEIWRVEEADQDGAVIECCPIDADGDPTGEPTRQSSTWTALRNHATFPAATSTLAEVNLVTRFGALDCWLYRVTDPESGAVKEYHFARDLPGPPVRYSVIEDGVPVETMTQVERWRP